MASPAEWYNSLPPVTKTWGTACLITTVLATLQVVHPIMIYFDSGFILSKFQIWRLVTCFLFLGKFGIKFAINLLLLARYGVQLESVTYRGRTADYLFMLLFGMVTMLAAKFLIPVSILRLPFLAASLCFMVLYVWSREFPTSNVNVMGLLTVQAFWLPWVYLVMDLLFGADLTEDLLGILVGHLYYFLTVIYPRENGRVLISTPLWLRRLVARWNIGQSAGSGPYYPPEPPPRPAQPGPPGRPSGPAPAASGTSSAAFRGRGYRLDRD